MLHAVLAVVIGLPLLADPQSDADPAAALEQWRATHGSAWTGLIDARSGHVRSLWGGHTAPAGRTVDDAAALRRGRELAVLAEPLFGIDAGTLQDERALFLPLANAGSSDKYCASFQQSVRGVPVAGGHVLVLMDLEGRGLSLESTAVPGAELARTTPIREPALARSEAVRAFARLTGFPATSAGEPRLVLDPVADANGLRAALAWEVDVFGEGPTAVPRGLRLRLLDDDLSTSSREELVHTCDVTGTVYTRLTPGFLPDIPSNPPVQAPLAHVIVQSAQGSAVTDASGQFNIVGATAPLAVTVSYDGPFTTVTDAAAPLYSLPATLNAPSGNTLIMNTPAQASYTAEANSTHWIGRLRDYVRLINPFDTTADFDALSNVNLAQTCNAYYAGNSVNFFAAGGGCVNTAYSTVIAHEMGHWLNQRYLSNNGPDGFGEGNADAWAMYLTDQPVVGDNFFGTGSIIRTGLNTRSFCGDTSPGCYGEVHADGEVLMGALWKVRARLKTSLGSSAGAAAADTLFNSWMNAYNDGQIKTFVRTHWLVLDDDDGDINDGTPHFGDIDQGFRDQGFPPYPVAAVSLSGITQLPNTTNEAGPYVVQVTAHANLAPPLAQVLLRWRANGGAFNTLAMTPIGGSQYSASIPGQASPKKVEYWIQASDAQGASASTPSGAPATLYRFVVGEERVYYSDAFDLPWTSWQSGSSSGTNDWQYQSPAGLGGDPALPRTGIKCWGTDLGNAPFDGLYSPGVTQWIQSPPIDLSTCPFPRLRFQRWLTVESALHDQARVLVNGQQVFANTTAGDTLDLGWTEVEYDVTAQAAGLPQTVVRIELASDGQVQKGGWNVDDVQIVTMSAVGQGCTDPVQYCTAKLTSAGLIPKLSASGAPSQSLAGFHLELREAAASKPGILLRSSTGQAAAPFSGGTLCLQAPIVRQAAFTSDIFGYANLPLAITAPMVGQTWWLQAWFRDPPASFGVGLSNGVQVKFCP